jgi:hypothetical protein
MSRHFSSHELFVLRNYIPIDILIEVGLNVPAKVSEGYFRFLCPICNEFQTATNPKTNLARCFRCEKNFNTIDMVMICQKSNFIESVKYLKSFRR